MARNKTFEESEKTYTVPVRKATPTALAVSVPKWFARKYEISSGTVVKVTITRV